MNQQPWFQMYLTQLSSRLDENLSDLAASKQFQTLLAENIQELCFLILWECQQEDDIIDNYVLKASA